MRAKLAAEGYSNVVAGPFYEGQPADAIAVLAAPGAAPQALLNGGANEVKQEGIQVLVRSNQGDFAGGKQRARNIYDDLRFYQPAGYIDIRPQGTWSYIGADDQGRHQFSLNFIAQIQE